MLNYYGYMLADRGERLDEAVTMLQRALAEDPNNPAYLDSLGWAYFKQNKLAEAEAYIRKALAHQATIRPCAATWETCWPKAGAPTRLRRKWEKAVADWHRALPAEYEAAKVAELEQKISNLKPPGAAEGAGDSSSQ